MVHHEGLLELDAIYLFETSPRVTRYREQMPPIHYADGARTRRYTPDFEVTLNTGDVITVEVKSRQSLADDEVHHKIECIKAYYRRLNQQFVVLTETTLRLEPRQSNLRWLYHQMPRTIPQVGAIRAALKQINGALPTTIAQANALLGSRAVDSFSALILGGLTCRLDVPASFETQVELAEESGHAWFLVAPEFGF